MKDYPKRKLRIKFGNPSTNKENFMSKACTGCEYLTALCGNTKVLSYQCNSPRGSVNVENKGGRPMVETCPLHPKNLNDTHSENPTVNK